MNFAVILLTLIFIVCAYVYSFVVWICRVSSSIPRQSHYDTHNVTLVVWKTLTFRKKSRKLWRSLKWDRIFYLIPVAISIRSTPPQIETPVLLKLLNWHGGVTWLYSLRKNKCQGLLAGNIWRAYIRRRRKISHRASFLQNPLNLYVT